MPGIEGGFEMEDSTKDSSTSSSNLVEIDKVLRSKAGERSRKELAGLSDAVNHVILKKKKNYYLLRDVKCQQSMLSCQSGGVAPEFWLEFEEFLDTLGVKELAIMEMIAGGHSHNETARTLRVGKSRIQKVLTKARRYFEV
jgi:hypothetical protein